MTYVPPNMETIVRDWSDGERIGEPCHVPQLEKYFKWMRGHHVGLYGYPGDGKGTFFDYIAVVKAMKEKNWKCAMFKPEDMNSEKVNGKTQITANNIYKKLAWTYTGKCPIKSTAERLKITQITLNEQIEAIDWVMKHFIVIYPEDQSFDGVMTALQSTFDIYGTSAALIDPWTSIILDEGTRGDYALRKALRDGKNFAMRTDQTLFYINHPVGMKEVRQSKDGPYKVVNQYMIAGGPTWDRALDQQFSVYRPHRHDAQRINDPTVHLYNLKVRDEEFVGSEKGMYEHIFMDKRTRRYYFDGVCAITGQKYLKPGQVDSGTFDFSRRYEVPMPLSESEVPF